MPSYKVSGGVEGAAATVFDVIQKRQAAQAEQEKELRMWNQKLREIVFSNPEKYDEKFVSALISGEAFTPADYIQKQRKAVERSLPQTPFVAGPGGGFITGSEVEAAPGYTTPRPDVVSAMTPSIFKSRMQEIYGIDQNSGKVSKVGEIPHTGKFIGGGSGVTGYSQADPLVADRIRQLLEQGISKERIVEDLIQKGIDPTQYGL